MSFHQVLDQLVAKAKYLDETSTRLYQQHLFYPPIDLNENEKDIIDKQILNLQMKCKEKWEEMVELRNQIRTIENRNQVSNSLRKNVELELLRYEKLKLQHTITKLEEDNETVSIEPNSLIRTIQYEQTLSNSFTNHQQLITELKIQLKFVESKKDRANKDLSELLNTNQSLLKKIENIKITGKIIDKENLLKKKLNRVEKDKEYYRNILKEFIKIAYPPRSIQTKLDSSKAHLNKSNYPPKFTTLIEDLVKLNESNSYYQLPFGISKDPDGEYENSWTPYLNLLAKADLISFHPKDPSKFKLVSTEVWND